MNLHQDPDIDLIDKFLKGLLTDEESNVFEQKMSNPDFVKKIDLHKTAIEAIELGTRDMFKEQLKTEETRIRNNKKTIIKRLLPYAAILILGALIVKFFVLRPLELSQEEATYALFDPYPIQKVISSRGSDSIDIHDKALIHYNEKEYTKAIQEFQTLTNLKLIDSIYIACAYISVNNNNGALSILDQLKTDGNKKNTIRWYKAVSQSLLNRNLEAISNLKEIIESNDPVYSEEATKLLKILEGSRE